MGGSRSAFALVLANKHINSKFDNKSGKKGMGQREGQSLVLKNSSEGAVIAGAMFGVGEGTVCSEALLKVWLRNFSWCPVAGII